MGVLGLVLCSVALVVNLVSYINLSRVSNAPLPETYRTLFLGFLLFPIGIVLSAVVLRRAAAVSPSPGR